MQPIQPFIFNENCSKENVSSPGFPAIQIQYSIQISPAKHASGVKCFLKNPFCHFLLAVLEINSPL